MKLHTFLPSVQDGDKVQMELHAPASLLRSVKTVPYPGIELRPVSHFIEWSVALRTSIDIAAPYLDRTEVWQRLALPQAGGRPRI